MGHTRLGNLPRSKKWKEVIGLLFAGAGAEQVAGAVMHAAADGLQAISHHKAMTESFFALVQLTAAAKEKDFASALRARGFDVPDHPSLPAILSAVSLAIDKALPNNVGRTDVGEMAQSAAVETINKIVTERTTFLFSATPKEVQQAFRELGTKKNFGELGKRFMGQLTNKLLQFYVSRESMNCVGFDQRFVNLAAKSEFDDSMERHCQQASVIVERFAGDWLSKKHWERIETGGITREDARGFTHVAMNKMIAELKAGDQ